MSKTGELAILSGIYCAICNEHGRPKITVAALNKFPKCQEGSEEEHDVNWELVREVRY